MPDRTGRRIEMPKTAFIAMEDNVPIPLYTTMPTSKTINDMMYAAAACEYEVRRDPLSNNVLPEDEKYIGWTCLEVMAHRRAQLAAQGDFESHKFVYERTLGKAVQQINTTNVNMTLADALNNMADRIEAKHPGLIQSKMKQVNVIDVSSVESIPQTLDDLG